MFVVVCMSPYFLMSLSYPPTAASHQDSHKLFVGNLPPDVTEGELLRLFCEYGELLEVFVMGGERSRSGQSSAFVKYGTIEECERAIAGVSQRGKVRPGDMDAVVVKYAKPHSTRRDNKRDSPDSGFSAVFTPAPSPPPTSAVLDPSVVPGKFQHPPLCKLFIGGLPPFVDRDDLIAIFAPFGHIDSVHLMQGKSKSGQACAFITYQYPGPAHQAIEILSGHYRIEESAPPISVRFADSESGSSVVLPGALPPPKRQKSLQASPLTSYLRDPVEAAVAASLYIVGPKGG